MKVSRARSFQGMSYATIEEKVCNAKTYDMCQSNLLEMQNLAQKIWKR
jgi:hypothetical protein